MHAAQYDCQPAIPLVLSVRFTAEVPELHDHISNHLRTCVSARSWGRFDLGTVAPDQLNRG
jgi:hypothetical protein